MNLIQELKYNFQKQDNGLIKLILLNVIVFLVISVIHIVCAISENDFVYAFAQKELYLPAPFFDFIERPWTLFTYFFSQEDVLHILFNMLMLYWFGRIITDHIGNRRLINLYILGGLMAGVFYLLMFNLIPFFIKRTPFPGLIGSSGSVFAIVVAAATLLPNYTVYMLFLGPVRIIYIAIFYIVVSFLGTIGDNSGGNIAHLGGALIGFIYIRQLQRGTDIGQPINFIAAWFKRIGKPRMKVSYINKDRLHHDTSPSQKEIDDILDKISRSGYESLSKDEKQKLFKASQK